MIEKVLMGIKSYLKRKAIFLLQFSLAIIALMFILGLFDRLSWYLDVLCHFRVQYFYASLIIGLIFMLIKNPKYALISIGIAVINFLYIIPLYTPQHFKKVEKYSQEKAIKVISLNVHTDNKNYSAVLDLVKNEKPDILVLEEIDKTWINSLPELNVFKYKKIEPRQDNFGIGVFSNINMIDSKIQYFGQDRVPSIISDMLLNTKKFTFIATHPLPPGGEEYFSLRNSQLKAIAESKSRFNNSLVLVGDLNTTSWSYYYKKMIKDLDLYDSRKGFGIQPTWPSKSLLIKVPIDHCMVSKNIKVIKRQVGNDVGSDHRPIIISMIIE